MRPGGNTSSPPAAALVAAAAARSCAGVRFVAAPAAAARVAFKRRAARPRARIRRFAFTGFLLVLVGVRTGFGNDFHLVVAGRDELDASELEGRFEEPDGFEAVDRGLRSKRDLCWREIRSEEQRLPRELPVDVENLAEIGIGELDELGREPLGLRIVLRPGWRFDPRQPRGIRGRRDEDELVESRCGGE